MDTRKLSLFTATVVLLVAGFAPPLSQSTRAAQSPRSGVAWDDTIRFIENVGQFHSDARFLAQGDSTSLWLDGDGMWLTTARRGSEHVGEREPKPRQAVNLRLSFSGAAPQPRIEPFGRQDARVHYYLGHDPAQWRSNVPVWSGVRYVGLYPGVDLEIGGMNGRWVWRLICRLSCRTALQDVRLRLEGAEGVAVDGAYLRLDTAVGDLMLPLLAAGDVSFARRPDVDAMAGGAFEVAAPFSPAALAGDAAPAVDYSEDAYFGTYLGGSSTEWSDDVAVGGSGDVVDSARQRAIYVTGWTTSPDFPTDPPGATTLNGTSDAFVTKLRRVASYVTPDYSAYIGGSIQERGTGIAVDGDDNVYLTGWTSSSDFPVTPDAFDPTFNTCGDCQPCSYEVDAFVAKLDSTGVLTYSTYLGGSHYSVPGLGKRCGEDEGAAIAVDASGYVYVTGSVYSEDFPTTPGAYDRQLSNPSIGVNQDTFVAKLDPSISGSASLLYATYVGGGIASQGKAIAVDGSGTVYVTGYAETFSGQNLFPTTPGAYDREINRGSGGDAFAFKLDPAGNGAADMVYSTLLGGIGVGYLDQGEGIVVDAAGRMYVAGRTSSPNFPITSGAYDTTCGSDGACDGRTDAFVTELNPAGGGQTDLVYSTFVGGNYFEGFLGEGDIALGPNGDVYITGDTGSDAGFPITPDAYDLIPDTASCDAYVVRLRLQGNGASDLVYGTYLGGSDHDHGSAIALDRDGRVYVVGDTESWDFPTTQRAFDKFYNGGQDAFAIRLLAPPAPDLSASTKAVDRDEAVAGEVVTFTVHLVNSGVLSAAASFTDTLPSELLLQGSPASSSGAAPNVDGQTITWSGVVTGNTTVDITYATLLTSTVETEPTACNYAQVDDGYGHVYVRRTCVNGWETFLPLVVRDWK
jgi:uncharacterized repeat protein (TIGR01451 family)